MSYITIRMERTHEKIKRWEKEKSDFLEKANEYYDKKFDLYKKLENDGLITLKEKREVILNWKDANPHQKWMMGKYQEYNEYYNQLQIEYKNLED